MPNGLKLLYDFKHLNDTISPTGQAHFWGQPLWGYYNSEDEWVIRKQISMLTTAGIDFIAFDLTNRVTYKKVYEKVFAIIEDLQKQGQHPPKALFYTHSKSIETTWQLYKDLYNRNSKWLKNNYRNKDLNDFLYLLYNELHNRNTIVKKNFDIIPVDKSTHKFIF
jgi:hypothetical protein